MKIALFDFDGVIVDTEPIYDIFWNESGDKYETGIENFADVIKGATLPNIIQKYFGDRPVEFQKKVFDEASDFESKMPLPPMPGSVEFLHTLKESGVRMGLVTSSDTAKVKRAFREMQLDGLFDILVTADRITKGKPDPMCYLLAAADLGVSPEECIVFEDSFAGIQSGNAAGMRVIGLSTTNPAEKLKPLVYRVIPDFRGVTLEDYLGWQS